MPKGARFMGARFQIEKLNLIANPQNRKRPGTPINKRGAHIVMLFFGIYTGAGYIYSTGRFFKAYIIIAISID